MNLLKGFILFSIVMSATAGTWASNDKDKKSTNKANVLSTEMRSLEQRDFPIQMQIEDKQVKLLGLGIRKVDRFGLSFKVYVAGLYLQEPEVDAEKILTSKTLKVLQLQFLRRVKKKDLTKAWTDGVYKNCRKNCDNYREAVGQLNQLMSDVGDDSVLTIQFHADKIVVHMEGREKKQGVIKDAALSENLLAVFLGPKPPNKELKQGLLEQGRPRT